MFDGLWAEIIGGGLGSLNLLSLFILFAIYVNKFFVKKDSFNNYIKLHDKDLKQHDKDLEQMEKLFTEKFDYIKDGIKDIRERLDHKNETHS